MLAVLRDALECLSGRPTGTGGLDARRSAQEAAQWVTDTNEKDLFSFNSVCDVLGLDPAAVRKALMEWPISDLRIPRRSPVTGEAVKLSLAAYRKRILSVRGIDNRAPFKGKRPAPRCLPRFRLNSQSPATGSYPAVRLGDYA